MERTAINPTTWGLEYAMNQAEVTSGATRHLHASGQLDVVEDPSAPLGLSTPHPHDIRGQMIGALDAGEALLVEASMSKSDIVLLRFSTTDTDGFLANCDVYAKWIEASGVMPPESLIGVSRLVDPDLLVEIEVQAAA